MKATTRRFKKLALSVAGFLGLGLAMLLPASCGDDCEGKTYYGPPPCQTDQECVDEHGATWYCDKDNVIDEACDITWATCKEQQ